MSNYDTPEILYKQLELCIENLSKAADALALGKEACEASCKAFFASMPGFPPEAMADFPNRKMSLALAKLEGDLRLKVNVLGFITKFRMDSSAQDMVKHDAP